MTKRLGKGLDALISKNMMSSSDDDSNLSIEKIQVNKHQPRDEFDDSKMDELVESIKENGILQPLAVRSLTKNKVELIAGERRLRAAKKAGLTKVPVYYIDIDSEENMMEYALVENIQRDNLNPLEEAAGYALLSEKYGLSHKQIAKRVGKSRSEISNKIRLLKLSPQIRNSLRKKEINYGHAKAIGELPENKIQKILSRIKRDKLSVRDTESLIKKLSFKPIKKKYDSKLLLYIEGLENKIIDKFGNKAQIKMNSNGKGKIIIDYYSKENLDDIIDAISKIK